MNRARLVRTTVRVVVTLGMLVLLSISATAHDVKYFWKYDPRLFWEGHSYRDHAALKTWHERWHHNHPGASDQKHREFHHLKLRHAHQERHYHDVLAKQEGDATWYALAGEMGACGKPLRGMYAAHRRWKCGSLVSVRAGNRHIFVRIMDRGPFGEGRVIDLSKRAFRRLAPPSKGVIDVKIYRLER
jgi:rare lipoprotein A